MSSILLYSFYRVLIKDIFSCFLILIFINLISYKISLINLKTRELM
jgi:hypothetical protein